GGDGDERVGVLDAGGLEHRTAVGVALVEAAREARGEQPAAPGVTVHDADVVALGDESGGEQGTGPPAAGDDHSHRVSPSGAVRRRRSHAFLSSSATSTSTPRPVRSAQSPASSGAVLNSAWSGGR